MQIEDAGERALIIEAAAMQGHASSEFMLRSLK